MIPARDTPHQKKRHWHLDGGQPQPGSATLYPRIERHTANFPHFKGILNIDNTMYWMAVWKREREVEGVRHPLLTMQIRFQDFAKQREAMRALRLSGEPQGKRLQAPGHGIAFPKVHRETERSPHWKGELNVFGTMYWFSAWRRTFWKETPSGARLQYPALIVRVHEKQGRYREPPDKRMITEPNKPAWLCDHDSMRKFLMDEGEDPKRNAEQYEYERQLERERRRGSYV